MLYVIAALVLIALFVVAFRPATADADTRAQAGNPNALEPDVFGGDGNADLDPESDTDYDR